MTEEELTIPETVTVKTTETTETTVEITDIRPEEQGNLSHLVGSMRNGLSVRSLPIVKYSQM